MHRKKIVKEVVHIIITMSNNDLSVLTVNELSRKLGRNRCTLSKEFSKYTNLLLKDYILKEKIHRATRVLESCDSLCVTVISEQFGFRKVDVFIKYFTKINFVTPYQYWKLKKMQQIGGCF